jgi:hypothetical protein
MSLPWIPGAIRQLLLADATFSTSCAGRCGTRLPSDMTSPFAQLRISGGVSISGDGVAFSPLVQVDGWCAPGGAEDPEIVSWRIASEAARVLGRARNITYQTMRYSARLIDGPLSDVDTSRGTSSPLYRALIRAELSVHTT